MTRIKNKIVAMLLALLLLCSLFLTACTDKDNSSDDDSGKNQGTPGGEVEDGDEDDEDGDTDGEDEEITSLGVILRDISVSSLDGGAVRVDIVELYFGLNEDGAIIGEGYGVLVNESADGDESAQDIILAIGADRVYIATWQSVSSEHPDNDGVSDSFLAAEEKIVQTISLSAFLGKIEQTVGIDVEALLYAAAESPDALSGWFGSELIPALGSLNSSLLIGKIEQYKELLFEKFIREENDDEENVCVIDLTVLSEWHDILSENTVKEVYELIFGAGSFVDFKTAVTASLTVSVKKLIEDFESNGASSEKLFSALDSLAAILTADECKTLEELLGLESDIEDMLSDPEISDFTVSSLLMNITGAKNDVELSMIISDFYKELGEKTIYEYIGNPAVPEFIGSLCYTLSEYVDIRYTKDADGNPKDIYIKGDTRGEGENLLATIARYINIVYSNQKISFRLTADSGYFGEISGEVEIIEGCEPVFGGKIYAALCDRLSDIPSEDELTDAVISAFRDYYGEDVSFTYDELGDVASATVLSYAFGEVSDGLCEYTVEEKKIYLAELFAIGMKYGEEKTEIFVNLILDEDRSVYDIPVTDADGEYIYHIEAIDQENPKIKTNESNILLPIFIEFDTVSGDIITEI